MSQSSGRPTKRITVGVGAVLALTACPITAVAVASSSHAAPTSRIVLPVHKSSTFSATIRRGPDRGLAVAGTLSGKLSPSGEITGKVSGIGQTTRVTGRLAGRSLKLVFHLPGGRVMNGVGRSPAKHTKNLASILTKGTFTGPRNGDRGDWGGYTTQCHSVFDPTTAGGFGSNVLGTLHTTCYTFDPNGGLVATVSLVQTVYFHLD